MNDHTMSLSRDGLALLKRLEGFRSEAYQDSAGVWTIGFGHTADVKPGDTITSKQAADLLADDVTWAENAVHDHIERDLTQSQFDALVLWTFNLGAGALESSTLRKQVNAGRHELVPSEMTRWVYAGGKRSKGLARRRVDEAALYLSD